MSTFFYKKNINKILYILSGIILSGIVFYSLDIFNIIPNFEKIVYNNNNNTFTHLQNSTRRLRPLPPILPSLEVNVIEYPWKCIPYLNIPVRINKRLDAECMSFNANICINTANKEDCNLLININFS
mgnify:CR=1 FL=1